MSLRLLIILFILSIPHLLPAQSLTIYSGRSKALVDPLINQFESETGISVRVRYGGTTQLAVAILEEGSRSPADLFWAQDAGALGAVNAKGLFKSLPKGIVQVVSDQYRGNEDKWVATSGRARVLAYSTVRVDTTNLPESIFDLTEPHWKDRLGWAPANGSFQAFLTALRKTSGDEQSLKWLKNIKSNGVQNYANNTAILQAIAAGEIDLGITNHYYLHRFLESDPSFPVDQTFFKTGDPGNLVNISGIGILNSTVNNDSAEQFIKFLLSPTAQEWFVKEIYEYPVNEEVNFNLPKGKPVDHGPDINLEELGDLEATLKMLREAGLL
ncbi:MAG: iron ABC transporter substrate-binding protein [Balneolales bacterium]